MINNMDSKTRAAGIVLAVVVALVLLQRTSFAPLPASTNDFLGGFAIGVAIVFVIALFARKAGNPDS